MAKRTMAERFADALGQAAGHLDAAADGHSSKAADRADQATTAHGHALGHGILGLLGREGSDDRAAAARDAADEHTVAAMGHALTSMAMRLASSGLGLLAGQVIGDGQDELPAHEAPVLLPERSEE